MMNKEEILTELRKLRERDEIKKNPFIPVSPDEIQKVINDYNILINKSEVKKLIGDSDVSSEMNKTYLHLNMIQSFSRFLGS